MELELKREIFTEKSTIGSIYVNGEMECFCIEDKDRGLHSGMSLNQINHLKIHAQTAIPKGEYQIIVTMSNRFKKNLPLLLDVPGYAGIRIHAGNKSEDTEGCLLPGVSKATDFVGGSKIAFEKLFIKIQDAINKGEIVKIKIS